MLTKLRNWFIGDYLSKTEDVFERSKILLLYNYSLFFITAGSVFYTFLIFEQIWYHVYIISFAMVALFTIPFILKITQNVKIASNWYCIQQILVSVASVFIQEGVPDMAGAYWTMSFVLFAFFLYGSPKGFWVFLVFLIGTSISAGLSKLTDIPDNQQIHESPIYFLIPLVLDVFIVWQFIKTRGYAEKQINEQKILLQQQHEEVTSSINYANRIQNAILPHDETIDRAIPLYFIFYKPKDIVSGDFYWFHEVDKENYIIVCADCTGHGVPGAFMTVIGSSLLNLIIVDNKIVQPSKILAELDKQLSSMLKQDKERFQSVQDGMDLTVVKVNKSTNELIFSSAKRPALFIHNKELKEFKGSKLTIGGMRMGEKKFEDIIIQCKEDDMVYFFTDGYTDQFGGPKGKKYSSKRLREKFLEIHQKTMSEQKHILGTSFEQWMGNLEQIDDVCIIGIRF